MAAAQEPFEAGREPEAATQGRRLMLLIDPAWQPSEDDEGPPLDAVLGGWSFDEDGGTRWFEPNPDYRPSRPDSPTDPVDAALQAVVRGDADGAQLLAVLRESPLGVALNEEGEVIIAPAPDDVPSVLVTTAPAHRTRCDVAGWAEVGIAELAEVLPDKGIDVLLNPGAPSSLRIEAHWIKNLPAAG
ncbi:type VII secretion system-associated protein [Amycolatopsis sp. NPDC049868]|uniref:type VII secretion system-associated protein n=1 Tax=Amycolatopsis sp. NPDC049868 TaxID=3363934 RepID=UPI0037A8FA6C